MENIIENLISQGPIGIVCAAIVYLIVYLQRKSTGDRRDREYSELEKRITLVETEIEQIKKLDLDARLASIETSLKYIESLLKDIKNKD